jgi:hypothetical protein
MFSILALLSLCVLLSAAIMWATYARRRRALPPELGRLLERAELVDGFAGVVAGQSFLKGQFRGRNVVVLLQQGEEESTLLITMETHGPRAMDTYDFAGYKGDREGEVALFALEVKHELKLRHLDGYLKAEWQPLGFLPRSFNRSKWQSVLEAMDALAGSIERRVASSAQLAGPPV